MLSFRSYYESFDADNGTSIWYHAGPFILTKDIIRFDLGSMGFHLGTKKQVEYISKGTYKRGVGKNLKISEFRLYDNYGDLYTETIETDMPWEDARMCVVYLVYAGIVNEWGAEKFLNSLGIDRDDDDDESKSFFIALDKIKRYGSENYHPSDDLYMMSEHSAYFKHTESLGMLRRLLVDDYSIGAIKYLNEAEGVFSEHTYSVCLLDKSLVADSDMDVDTIRVEFSKREELMKLYNFDKIIQEYIDKNGIDISFEVNNYNNLWNSVFEDSFGLKYIRTLSNMYYVYKITDKNKYSKIKRHI